MTRARAVRRTQAERTAATRERIVRAVVESIAEIGLQKTTANEITRRAGVTWGAVQHHFGGKDGILAAVLEESFERFAERLSEVPTDGASLEERVSAFVDIAWAHFDTYSWNDVSRPGRPMGGDAQGLRAALAALS